MEKIELTKKEIECIIDMAFKSGESWGVTYSTWFTPTKKDQTEQLNKTIDNIFNTFHI